MKVSVLGAGNVGIAIAADLSIKGHEVTLIKTSDKPSAAFERLHVNGNRVFLKENGEYKETKVFYLTDDVLFMKDADVVFVTIQSTYHEELYKRIAQYVNGR